MHWFNNEISSVPVTGYLIDSNGNIENDAPISCNSETLKETCVGSECYVESETRSVHTIEVSSLNGGFTRELKVHVWIVKKTLLFLNRQVTFTYDFEYDLGDFLIHGPL